MKKISVKNFYVILIYPKLIYIFFSDCSSIPRLQRSVYVGYGVCHDDLSVRIYVPSDTTVTNVYELCGAVVARANTLRDRDTRFFFVVQEEF